MEWINNIYPYYDLINMTIELNIGLTDFDFVDKLSLVTSHTKFNNVLLIDPMFCCTINNFSLDHLSSMVNILYIFIFHAISSDTYTLWTELLCQPIYIDFDIMIGDSYLYNNAADFWEDDDVEFTDKVWWSLKGRKFGRRLHPWHWHWWWNPLRAALWWEDSTIIQGFFRGTDDFQLNLFYDISDYGAMDQICYEYGWWEHMVHHEGIVRLLYLYEPRSVYHSGNSYSYYALQSYTKDLCRTVYTKTPGYFDPEWFDRFLINTPVGEWAFHWDEPRKFGWYLFLRDPDDDWEFGPAIRDYDDFYQPWDIDEDDNLRLLFNQGSYPSLIANITNYLHYNLLYSNCNSFSTYYIYGKLVNIWDMVVHNKWLYYRIRNWIDKHQTFHDLNYFTRWLLNKIPISINILDMFYPQNSWDKIYTFNVNKSIQYITFLHTPIDLIIYNRTVYILFHILFILSILFIIYNILFIISYILYVEKNIRFILKRIGVCRYIIKYLRYKYNYNFLLRLRNKLYFFYPDLFLDDLMTNKYNNFIKLLSKVRVWYGFNVLIWSYKIIISDKANIRWWKRYVKAFTPYMTWNIIYVLLGRGFFFIFFLSYNLILRIVRQFLNFIFFSPFCFDIYYYIYIHCKLILKYIITLNIYKNIWLLFIKINDLWTTWLFFPAHFFFPSEWITLWHRECSQFYQSTYTEYPLSLDQYFYKLLRPLNPIIDKKPIGFFFKIFNILYIIIIYWIFYLISICQIYITKLLSLFVYIISSIDGKIYFLKKIYFFFKKIFFVLFSLTNIFICEFARSCKKMYKITNNFINPFSYIISLIFYIINFFITNFFRFIILLPLIIICRLKFFLLSFLLIITILDLNTCLDFLYWIISIGPSSEFILYIRESTYGDYFLWLSITGREVYEMIDTIFITSKSYVFPQMLYRLLIKQLFDLNDITKYVIEYYWLDGKIYSYTFNWYQPLWKNIKESIIRLILLLYFALNYWLKYKWEIYKSYGFWKTPFVFFFDLGGFYTFTFFCCTIPWIIKYIIFLILYYISIIWLFIVPYTINVFLHVNIGIFTLYDNLIFGQYNLFRIQYFISFNENIWLYCKNWIQYNIIDFFPWLLENIYLYLCSLDNFKIKTEFDHAYVPNFDGLGGPVFRSLESHKYMLDFGTLYKNNEKFKFTHDLLFDFENIFIYNFMHFETDIGRTSRIGPVLMDLYQYWNHSEFVDICRILGNEMNLSRINPNNYRDYYSILYSNDYHDNYPEHAAMGMEIPLNYMVANYVVAMDHYFKGGEWKTEVFDLQKWRESMYEMISRFLNLWTFVDFIASNAVPDFFDPGYKTYDQWLNTTFRQRYKNTPHMFRLDTSWKIMLYGNWKEDRLDSYKSHYLLHYVKPPLENAWVSTRMGLDGNSHWTHFEKVCAHESYPPHWVITGIVANAIYAYYTMMGFFNVHIIMLGLMIGFEDALDNIVTIKTNLISNYYHTLDWYYLRYDSICTDVHFLISLIIYDILSLCHIKLFAGYVNINFLIQYFMSITYTLFLDSIYDLLRITFFDSKFFSELI